MKNLIKNIIKNIKKKEQYRQKTADNITLDEFRELILIDSEEYMWTVYAIRASNPEDFGNKDYFNMEREGLTSKFLINKDVIREKYSDKEKANFIGCKDSDIFLKYYLAN
jgi:hypothetical protein